MIKGSNSACTVLKTKFDIYVFFQWDIIVRRSTLVNKYNLPDYGAEPWTSLHDFDEIFDRKLGKPAVSWYSYTFPFDVPSELSRDNWRSLHFYGARKGKN